MIRSVFFQILDALVCRPQEMANEDIYGASKIDYLIPKIISTTVERGKLSTAILPLTAL